VGVQVSPTALKEILIDSLFIDINSYNLIE